MKNLRAFPLGRHKSDSSTRKLGKHELTEVLDLHDLWCRSKEKNGMQANLRRLNLSGQDLSNRLLMKADLRQADLRYSNLSGAQLGGALLASADLSKASLQGASLDGAHCGTATFIGANLSGAFLRATNLRNSILVRANLSKANCRSATLMSCDLGQANLRGIDLRRSKLDRARLVRANLEDADLREANLGMTDFSGACLTGAKIWEIQRSDWTINNAICNFVYADPEGVERLPKNRDFVQGEFVELFGSFPTIEYFFANGFNPIDPILISKIVGLINDENPDIGLQLDSFSALGLHPNAKFRVANKDTAEQAIRLLTVKYEDLRKRLSNSVFTISITSAGGHMNIGGITINGNMNGIIGDNGTVAQTIADSFSINIEQASALLEALDSNPDKEHSSVANELKTFVKDELKKIAAGEISTLSQKSIQWLKEYANAIDLPTLGFRISDLFR